MTDRDLEQLVARHARVFAALDAPTSPAELHDRAFLDGIYERAGRALESDLPAEVRTELAAKRTTPGDADEGLLESPALRRLEPTRAPGLLGPRLTAEIRELAGKRRRAHRRTRIVRGLAAAAVVTFAVWIARPRPEAVTADQGELVIVRLEANAPFAPGFSTSEVVRRITAGGHDAR